MEMSPEVRVELRDPARPLPRLSWRDAAFVGGIAILMAAAHSMASPFVANQNQYFAHVVGPRSSALADDYLVSTKDPYPFFTAVMGGFYDLGGTTAVRALSFMATVTALIAVFLIARRLASGRGLGVPVVAMMLVGATLSVGRLGSFLPYDWTVSAFEGFAGQYLLIKPGYVQPTTAGILVLLAVPLLLSWHRGSSPSWRFALPVAGLLALAGAFAPTNMVIGVLVLLAAAVADLLVGRGWYRVAWFAGIAGVTILATVAGNPSIVAMAGGEGPEAAAALTRFAFERIAYHTLLSNWPPDDSSLLLLVAIAVILAPTVREGRWLTRWLLVAAGVALATAVVVYATRWTALALLFPWRVSVIVIPVASTMVAVWLAGQISRLPTGHWRWKAALVAVVLALPGLASTAAKGAPEAAEPAVAAVVAAQPTGTGLIPPASSTVRLNAEVPVFVDWGAPPYASDDLVEWWRRIDAAEAVFDDPETFCSSAWASDIDWILLPAGTAPPTCTSTWSTLEASAEWTVIQRPSD